MLLQRYRAIFGIPAFRLFWVGFSLSALGDAATRVALTWYVFELTRSSEALGLLALAYTGPVVVSGLVVGSVLDRFDRRVVMVVDNFIRGAIIALIPVLHALGGLQLWHIYVAALVYGSLVMVSLAGSPALVPDLVEEEHLATANALEMLSYTVSGVIGPLLAGVLIPLISAPNVLILDAATYVLFGVLLLGMRVPPRDKIPAEQPAAGTRYRVTDAGRLLLRNPILLATTLMFMAANLGLGALFVWLPIFAADVLNGGSELYGVLLGALAVGELISSVLAGMIDLPLSLGRLIGICQALSGLALALLLVQFSIPLALLSLFLLGFFSAPLTIWAQTLRMKIIPPELRGRTFALLRMLMQSTNPAGGVVGGFLLPLAGIPLMIALSAGIVGLPGLLGLRVRPLRDAS